MGRTRIQLAAAMITLFGAAVLATEPAHAARPMACTQAQKDYMRQVAYDVCGSSGGTTYAQCNGMSISIVGVVCY